MGRPTKSPNRKRKPEKDPNRPKRPTSAYFYYAAKLRADAQASGESISKVAEFTKMVSAKWKVLSTSDRAPFDKQAEVDKARYTKEMANYSGKSAKDKDKPKRPQSGYFFFLADFREKNRDDFQMAGGHKELIKAAGESWNQLTKDEKKPFETKAAADKAKYEVAMAAYNKGGGGAAKKAKIEAANNQDDDDDEDESEEEEEEDSEEESDE